MEYFRFEINKPRSFYIATDIRIDAGRFCVSYEKIACMGHWEELTDFQFRTEQIAEKRKCLKMFWSWDDVFMIMILLGSCGFFWWLLQGPWQETEDCEVIGFFAALIAVTVLLFALRFTQTIELTFKDGSVRLIPIGTFLLGPVDHKAKDKIARFCRRICLDV